MKIDCWDCGRSWNVITSNKTVSCPSCGAKNENKLFSAEPEKPFPMARASDPETSHQAAAQYEEKLSERRRQVLDLVGKYPGSTQGELARQMLQEYSLPINVCAATPHKRLPELERMGLVKRGEARKCRDSGYSNATWWPNKTHRSSASVAVGGLR